MGWKGGMEYNPLRERCAQEVERKGRGNSEDIRCRVSHTTAKAGGCSEHVRG